MGRRGPKPRPEADLFWQKVIITPGCWLWTGHISKTTGYGTWRGNTAHRTAYRLVFGEVPAGLHLDHLKDRCSRRDCVNVLFHLEPVTQAENNRRSHPGPQPTCGRGHEMTPDNVYESSSGRTCRRCQIRRATARNRQIRSTANV
jgi:hypothetical protein